MNPRRIDVHQHPLPSFFAEAGLGDVEGWGLPPWSPESAIEVMDAIGTETAMLSTVLSPEIVDAVGRTPLQLSREANDFGASLVSDNGRRFGLFATLALDDVDGAVRELHRSYDELGADGVILLSNDRGVYLGDSVFEPLWQAIDERAAVVFIHPTEPQIAPLNGVPRPLVDYPFDTTRTAMHLVVNQVMNRFTKMKVILPHAGGFIPYAADRMVGATIANPSLTPQQIATDLRRFYFDTAISASGPALSALTEFAAPDHILFGSDWPFVPAPLGQAFATALGDFEHGHPQFGHSIDRGAGELLFPRFAS